MQNRIATAINMAYTGALAHRLENHGGITEETTWHFLDTVSEFAVRLLKGETIVVDGGPKYPDMKLSGDNLVYLNYKSSMDRLAAFDNPSPSQQQGYTE